MEVKIMLIAVFAFGIVAQVEAFQIISNNTDTTNGPFLVSFLRVEAEDTTSNISYPPQVEDDLMLDTLHPDIPNLSYSASSVSLTETNATIFPKTNNSNIDETNTSLPRQDNATVLPEANFSVSTGFPGVSTENPLSKCPEIGGPQVAGSVVKCHCQGNEIYVNGKCQVYDGVIVIPVQHDSINTKEENMTSYNVTVQDVSCDTSKYSYMEFTKNQFHLRIWGDVVLLKDAGELEGQRINNYCIFHHLAEYGELTWTMKACVPIPSVPRCCPPGKAMKEGKCEFANTPDVLKPPISAKPFSDGINWEGITAYHSPVKCDSESESLITLLLGHKQSHLLSSADGVANGWVPGDTNKRRVYYKCPEYCVDGINNPDDSVDYFTSFCYSDPITTHEEACAKGPCLIKCCKFGYSVNTSSLNCVSDPIFSFIPPTEANLSNYDIIFRMPPCTSLFEYGEKDFIVDITGRLMIRDKNLQYDNFCVDTFIGNEQREEKALACLYKTSLWIKMRPYFIPICNAISLFFLGIIIVSHLLVPKLLANGGMLQLCHAIALSIAWITSITVHVSHNRLSSNVCVNTAIAMQFGFLTTFFWLNVMCFEIWRKIRALKNYRPCKSYPNKYYMIYGWGIPLCLCAITNFTQKYFQQEVWELHEVNIAELRCLLKDDIALFLYFYVPVAVLLFFNSVFLFLTYINYKMILRNHREITNDLNVLGAGVTSEQRNKPARENTDHVHDFNQKLTYFILMATCWAISLVMAVLPWKIPPLELWFYNDTLNSLQGFLLFIILLSNSNKRKHLEEKCPRLFRWIRKFNGLPAKISDNLALFSTSSINSRFSNSAITRTLTTSVRSSNPSSASFNLSSSSSPPEVQSSVSLDSPDKGIIVLSHSSLRKSDSTQGPADPSFQSSKSTKVTPDSAC